MKIKRPWLLPFSPLYYMGISMRNSLFDLGIYSQRIFPVPVIAIGNLSVGGTGKTPVTIFLAKHLEKKYKVAVISRGYGRKTNGYLHQDEAPLTTENFGDEPCLIKQRVPSITLVVDGDRARAIQRLLDQKDPPEVILLDDAFQHRFVSRTLNLLLTKWDEPFFKDMVLPAGDLREPRTSSRRADLVWVTKCPENLADDVIEDMRSKIQNWVQAPVIFSTLEYGDPDEFSGNTPSDPLASLLLVTGLADPRPLVQHIHSKAIRYRHLSFPDHHAFSSKDYESMKKEIKEYGLKYILTTEKDAMRMDPKALGDIPILTQPIEIEIIHGKRELIEEIDQAVKAQQAVFQA